ncbi:MAG: Ig-like domain-containing protein [Blautia wexlerae]
MKKKCFKKTVSWALSIVMSATMAVTPVLADTFTDDSQSIISGNAEIPAVDVESATDCGDVASTEENLTEPALLQEEEFDNPEHVEFSGGNDAEAVSEFSDDSVPAAQTEGNTVVYLDPKLGNNANDGKSDTTAIKTLGNALTMARGGTIYLLNPINIDEDVTLENVTLENVTLRPGRANLEYMLNVKADKKVTLKNVKINNLTPENSSCIFSENPIQVYGTLTIEETIKDGTEIGPFPGKSCIDAENGSTVNLTGGTIQGNGQDKVEEGGGIYADHATVNMSGGKICNQIAESGGGIYAAYSIVNMSGGTISENTGGGIQAYPETVINMTGGTICENYATSGGGISVQESKVFLKGGIITNNKSVMGAGIYLINSSEMTMEQGEDSKICQITGNTIQPAATSQYLDNQGGGIFMWDSKAEISAGIISGNKAVEGYDKDGNVQGGNGGAISAVGSEITINESAELSNNSADNYGGAIYVEGWGTDQLKGLLSVDGGIICNNKAKKSGAGIFAKCLEKKTHMDVKISSGEIIGNYSGKEGNMQENAIMLSGMYNAQSSSKEIGLANLYLSGNPLIKGSVILSEYTDASQNSEGSCIYVKNDLSVNSPILVISATGTPGLTAVKYENETAPENYTSQFVSEKNGKVRLEKNGNTLQWASNKLVTFITYANITDKVLENAPKNVYVIPEDKIDSKDIPTAANIPGYERTGWQCISGESSNTWDPESQITEDMQVQEIWALKVPTVTIAKENGCPSSGIKLTAQAQHTCNDITYSYEWYKDNAPIDGQIEKTLTISEAGTYKVKVTATSPAKYQVSAEQSVAIPDTDFKHSYTWEHDQTTHWQYCSVGNENTTPEAHTFGDWTVTKQASIGVEGEKERTCTVCRYKETATIPAIYIPSYPVTGIKVSPDTLALTRKDETAQLTAEVIPSYADNTRVKWKSSDENVVTVDEKGKVTAVGNGTATITVTSVSGNYIATVAVTVKIPVEIEKISIEAEKETLTKIGESTELKVKIEPENADAQKLIWKSGDEMIAAVDENGKVTAIGNGTAIITVTTEDGKNTASITITVKIPDEPVINKTKGFGRLKVRSVNQTKTSITLEWSKLDGVDGYFVYGNRCNTKTKTYRYQKLATITNGRTWTHKNLKKGTFYKYIVKAYKIVDGKKVVTDTSASIHVITQGGKYGIAKSVSVTKIGNKKNVSKITLKKGKTAQITAKEIKKDKKIRHHRNLCYESSNTAVATVTPEGLIQAVGKGTCTIWVYAQNGVYAALTVTVK